MKENTEQKIQSALLSLLEDRSFVSISINDISEKAGIARQTFYTYFKSKDELLLSFMDDIFSEYLDALDVYIDSLASEKAKDMDSKYVVTHIFQTWLEHYDVLIHIVNADIDGLVFKRFRNYIARVTGRMIIKLSIEQVADETFINYTIDAVAGTMFHILMRWMKDKTPYPPETMAEIVGLAGTDSIHHRIKQLSQKF